MSGIEHTLNKILESIILIEYFGNFLMAFNSLAMNYNEL